MHFCPTLPINHQPHHIDCTLPCQNPLCCLDALAILVPLLPTCAWDSLFGFFHTCMPVLVYGFVCLIPLPVHHWLLVWSLTSWVGTWIKLKQDSWTLTLSVCGFCYNSCVKYYHLNHYRALSTTTLYADPRADHRYTPRESSPSSPVKSK